MVCWPSIYHTLSQTDPLCPGDVVRVGPNSLSFSTPQSYRDIYSHVMHGKKRFLKTKWYEADEPRIVRVRDPVKHAEQRRTLSHAFSARALRDQEDVVHRYVDLLLKQLIALGTGGRVAVNATEAWNWLTFDIIGKIPSSLPRFSRQTLVSDLFGRGLGVR